MYESLSTLFPLFDGRVVLERSTRASKAALGSEEPHHTHPRSPVLLTISLLLRSIRAHWFHGKAIVPHQFLVGGHAVLSCIILSTNNNISLQETKRFLWSDILRASMSLRVVREIAVHKGTYYTRKTEKVLAINTLP